MSESRNVFLAGVLAIVGAACGATRSSEPIAGPLVLGTEDLRSGELVFMQDCHACHILGEGGLGPALNDKTLPEFALRFQIRKGLGSMPGFSEDEIDDGRLDDLVAYVKALRRHARADSSGG